METPKIREYDKIKYSDKDMLLANSKLAVAIFVIAGIYFRFIIVEDNQTALIEAQKKATTAFLKEIEDIHKKSHEDKTAIYAQIKEKDDYQRLRLDTKTKRIEADSDKIWKEIDKLKLPNSDKE